MLRRLGRWGGRWTDWWQRNANKCCRFCAPGEVRVRRLSLSALPRNAGVSACYQRAMAPTKTRAMLRASVRRVALCGHDTVTSLRGYMAKTAVYHPYQHPFAGVRRVMFAHAPRPTASGRQQNRVGETQPRGRERCDNAALQTRRARGTARTVLLSTAAGLMSLIGVRAGVRIGA